MNADHRKTETEPRTAPINAKPLVTGTAAPEPAGGSPPPSQATGGFAPDQAGSPAPNQAAGPAPGPVRRTEAESPGTRNEAESPVTRGDYDGASDELPTEPAEIKRDIERTRAQLADTVDALASKANVSARVKEKAHETAETVQAKTEHMTGQAKDVTDQALAKLPPPAREKVEQAAATARQKPVPTAAAAAGLLFVVWWLARRRNKRET